MSERETWSGNLPNVTAETTSEDVVERFRRSMAVILHNKIAKGQSIGRKEAEALFALAQSEVRGTRPVAVGDI